MQEGCFLGESATPHLPEVWPIAGQMSKGPKSRVGMRGDRAWGPSYHLS